MRERAPEHQPDELFPAPSAREAGQVTRHEVTTRERGSFSSAACVCGWRGPARRARDRARTDAEEHAHGVGAHSPASE